MNDDVKKLKKRLRAVIFLTVMIFAQQAALSMHGLRCQEWLLRM